MTDGTRFHRDPGPFFPNTHHDLTAVDATGNDPV